MDRSWMQKHRFSDEYKNGVEELLRYSQEKLPNQTTFYCPCVKCLNVPTLNVKDIRNHLRVHEIWQRYTTWTWHDEVLLESHKEEDSATEERAETAAHAIELVRKSTADDIVNLCGKDGATIEGVADTDTATHANELVQKSTVDDIVDLWGKDKATGERVADESMSDDHISAAHHTEDFHPLASPYSSKRKRGKSSSSCIAPLRKKKAKRNGKLVVAITKLAATFEEYMHAATLKLDATEVYEEINRVKGLGGGEELRACMLFIENEQQFRMLKALPPEKKKSFILMFLSQAS